MQLSLSYHLHFEVVLSRRQVVSTSSYREERRGARSIPEKTPILGRPMTCLRGQSLLLAPPLLFHPATAMTTISCNSCGCGESYSRTHFIQHYLDNTTLTSFIHHHDLHRQGCFSSRLQRDRNRPHCRHPKSPSPL